MPDFATTKLLTGGGAVSLLVVADGTSRVIPLAADVAQRIGRAADADIVLEDGSLSRHHARFCLRGDRVEVEDLGSANGTIVRGRRLVAHELHHLELGDAVNLGTVLVVVQHRIGSIADRLRPTATAPDEQLLARIAKASISVLILGETGVGKEVTAERLHALGPRHAHPLVKLNCAALMPSVLESELFGHERGAFTGATRDKPGLIESADGGTLFLDEIGEADPNVQAKLLRVLEARETQRIGALRPTIVDVRFLAATNRVPADQIREGKLRQDLYYRLAGFTITIPPLRERMREIESLARDLLGRHGGRVQISRAGIARLQQHDWPGNVRELRNILDRAVVLATGDQITAETLADAFALEVPATTSLPPTTYATVDAERTRILGVLDESGGNQTIAAERLGMSRRALVYRLQAWGLTRPRRRGGR